MELGTLLKWLGGGLRDRHQVSLRLMSVMRESAYVRGIVREKEREERRR